MKHIDIRAFRCLLGGLIAASWHLASPQVAAADAEQNPWMTDRYEIEIVVFRHLDQSNNTTEQSAPVSDINASPLDLYPEPLPVQTSDSLGPMLDPRAQAAQRAEPPVSFYLMDLVAKFPDFVPLSGTGLPFNKVVQRLQRLDAYELMAHLAWMQPAREATAAIPFPVQSTVAGAFLVSGTITLYKERYVHMEVDLELEPVAPKTEPTADSWLNLGAAFADQDDIEPGQPPLYMTAQKTVYRLQESRRIRGVDAHYFDHPLFGVIARVREIKLDDDDANGNGR